MIKTLALITALSLALPLAGLAQSATQASVSTPMTPQELRSLVQSAHSKEQYKQLAAYFHQQETDYRARAAAEKIELDRRAQVSAGLYQKYPRPVDSAQYRYESYVSHADTAALQVRHYDQLAVGHAADDKQVASTSQARQ